MKTACTLMLLVCVLVSSSAGSAQGAGGPAPATPVEGVQLAAEVLERRIEAVGSLRANEAVMVRPEVAGRVASVRFNEGEAVKAGQALVALDTEIQSAELQRAEANLKLADVEFTRMNELLRRKAGSRTDYDKALSQREAFQADLALAKAKLAKMTVHAPFDGVLGLRQISVGDYISAGQDLVGIVDLDPIKVDFRVPEVYLDLVKPGQRLAVTVDALPGKSFEGELYAIDPQLDVNGRAIVLRARAANPDGVLKPGLFARVQLIVERRDAALLVPEEALLPNPDGTTAVFKVVDGKVASVPVKTGLRQAAKVEVVDGLAAGDTVITAGQMKVHPGMAVQVLAPTPSEKAM